MKIITKPTLVLTDEECGILNHAALILSELGSIDEDDKLFDDTVKGNRITGFPDVSDLLHQLVANSREEDE